MSIELLEKCNVNLTVGGWISDAGIHVPLNTKHRIQRLSFIFKTPTLISKESELVFGFFSKTPLLTKPDILRGDFGFPEIQVENIQGTTFRFKRGNIKDFYRLSHSDIQQTIHLPYHSFLFNVDLKENFKSNDDFFQFKIKKISFDFLANSNEPIVLNVYNPRFENTNKNQKNSSVFELLDVEKTDKSMFYPAFFSEKNQVSFFISLNDLCSKIYSENLELQWTMSISDKVVRSGTLDVGLAKTLLNLPLLIYGENNLELVLLNEGIIVGKSAIPVTRAYPRSILPCSKLGISDGYNLQGPNVMGGELRRVVIDLVNIRKKLEGGYQFLPNMNPLPALLCSSQTKVVVTLKGLPRWLSNSDTPDFYRYGPSDIEEYKKLMNWLITKFISLGIWAIEVWNEANVIHEWNDTEQKLLEMQKTVWDVVKDTSAPIKVLSPSTTSWDFDFFKKMTEAGLYNYCHGLAMHAYTYTPENHNELFNHLEDALEIASNGRKNFYGYITEVGFRCPTFSLLEQATYLSLFTLQAFFRPRIQSLIWFRYQNLKPEPLKNYDQNASGGYAMVGYKEQYCRPMMASYRFLDNYLSELTPTRSITVDSDEVIFEGIKNGRNILISYSFNRSHSYINRRPKFLNAKCQDLYGNEISIDSYLEQPFIFIIYN
jgi:hypothetical protein